MPSYAVQLAQRLVRCPSVTPVEGGALDLLQDEFTRLGFDCTRLPFGTGEKRIDNLFARRGTGGPHFAFAGHTDVCLLYTSPSPRDRTRSRMPSSA